MTFMSASTPFEAVSTSPSVDETAFATSSFSFAMPTCVVSCARESAADSMILRRVMRSLSSAIRSFDSLAYTE